MAWERLNKVLVGCYRYMEPVHPTDAARTCVREDPYCTFDNRSGPRCLIGFMFGELGCPANTWKSWSCFSTKLTYF